MRATLHGRTRALLLMTKQQQHHHQLRQPMLPPRTTAASFPRLTAADLSRGSPLQQQQQQRRRQQRQQQQQKQQQQQQPLQQWRRQHRWHASQPEPLRRSFFYQALDKASHKLKSKLDASLLNDLGGKKLVGKDRFGNQYFEQPPPPDSYHRHIRSVRPPGE